MNILTTREQCRVGERELWSVIGQSSAAHFSLWTADYHSVRNCKARLDMDMNINIGNDYYISIQNRVVHKSHTSKYIGFLTKIDPTTMKRSSKWQIVAVVA